MLSDDDVEKCRQAGFSHGGLRAEFCFESAARAIESAACAERDARIAELIQQLEEARKDAERWRYIAKFGTIDRTEFYWSNNLLSKAAVDTAIDAAIKEQT